jgi:flagellar biosynthetic protein FliP
MVFGSGAGSDSSVFRSGEPALQEQGASKKLTMPDPRDALRMVPTMLLYGMIWMAPMAALMVTAFVRINIVLVLLRQALGSPQIPGNQVLMVLALLLTALVMRPVGERVYTQAILPYTSGQATPAQAWAAGSTPIKTFMIDQIIQTKHQDHLWSLYRYAVPFSPGQVEPQYAHEFPFRIVAPAYLLSELTTALVIGFILYLPFLVIDLVVSAVLAAMGLYMLPPTLVAMPIKLIVFVLAVAGGCTAGRAGDQCSADRHSVARARCGAGTATGRGSPGPAGDPSLARWPVGELHGRPDRLDSRPALSGESSSHPDPEWPGTDRRDDEHRSDSS